MLAFVFFWDSTFRDNTWLTFLQDACSRLITHYIVTEGKPKGSDLVNLLKKAFDNINSNETSNIILHGDQAGENTNPEVEEFCIKKGIILSYYVKQIWKPSY